MITQQQLEDIKATLLEMPAKFSMNLLNYIAQCEAENKAKEEKEKKK